MLQGEIRPLGVWTPGDTPPAFSLVQLPSLVCRIREPLHIVQDAERGRLGVAVAGHVETLKGDGRGRGYPWVATLPPLYPEWLGDRSFLEAHRVRFPYIAGEMANGITTAEMVVAMAKHGMLAFFGAAGLSLERLEQGLEKIQCSVPTGSSWGTNLIHSPNEPELEEAVVDLYLRRGVRRVSASAYMQLTPAVVRYACSGLCTDPTGGIRRKNHVLAKISRPEVARHFFSPAPPPIVQALVASGRLSNEEARLAAHVPVAEDCTVEADSGGHTDNQALIALLPAILALKNEIASARRYRRRIRVGAAGGLGTPGAVAAAFSLGAAYVLTGSINQACVESGLSESGKEMLAQAGIADVIMAPAADMFELGIQVQVLKRCTLFGSRAQRLYDVYVKHTSLDALSGAIRARLEKEIFRAPLEEVWKETKEYFRLRNPREVERAEGDPKHRMALVFRWHLGQANRWAIAGEESRRIDFQIWCGPAMGAFNSWAAGSFLEKLANRSVTQLAVNLLEGAAVVLRAGQIRSNGIPVPSSAFDFRPRPLL